MGGSSKSKSSSTTNVTTETVDNTGAEIGGSVLTLGDVTSSGANSTTNISFSDQGAIEGAFAFGTDALYFADAQADRALGFGTEALDKVGMLAQQQQASSAKQVEQFGSLARELKTEGQAENRKLLLWLGVGSLAAVVVIAVVATSRGK